MKHKHTTNRSREGKERRHEHERGRSGASAALYGWSVLAKTLVQGWRSRGRVENFIHLSQLFSLFGASQATRSHVQAGPKIKISHDSVILFRSV